MVPIIMLPVALEYPQGDRNGFRAYRPARGGRSCEHFGGYKTINRIPFYLCILRKWLEWSWQRGDLKFHLIVIFYAISRLIRGFKLYRKPEKYQRNSPPNPGHLNHLRCSGVESNPITTPKTTQPSNHSQL